MGSRRSVSKRFRTERSAKAQVKIKGGEKLFEVPTRFSHDGKWIFVCSGSVVDVYSRSTRHVVCVLERHTAQITGMCLNDCNELQLITSSLDGQLVLWDYTDGAVLKTVDFGTPLLKFALGLGEQDHSMFFSIATGSDQVAIVGVSRACLTERGLATPPSQQLQESEPLMTSHVPVDFHFTHKGRHMVSTTGTGRKLLVYNFVKKQNFRYKCHRRVTALACHPTRNCIATGNWRGQIHLWYDFGEKSTDDGVTKTTLHWHAHAVGHLCFTTDGTYLLSGGEEGVLVLWTLKTNEMHFKPRLSAPITRVACAPADAYFTISLQSNVIQILSGLNLDVEGSLGGIRTAWLAPDRNGMKTGLVVCPGSKSLVFNSTPGVLQFYEAATKRVTELNVTGLNVVSRTDNKPVIHTTVDHVAFSPSGDWMATVESRDDNQTSPELRMKFWQFFTKWKQYRVNTCIDPPHTAMVTGVRFQPSPSHNERSNPHSGSSRRWNGIGTSSMAVTTSLDGKFKMWVLFGDSKPDDDTSDEDGVESEGAGGKGKSLWACRSVGYQQDLPCKGCAFSADGSLLAANFGKVVSLWTPDSCEMKTQFTPLPSQSFTGVEFGGGSSSQYVMTVTSSLLQIWDVLACSEKWRVCVREPVLVASPDTSIAAVFVKSSEDKVQVYQVDPSNHTPLSVHDTTAEYPILGSVYIPSTTRTNIDSSTGNCLQREEPTLYFMDSRQILFSLEHGSLDTDSGTQTKVSRTKLVAEPPSHSQRVFADIFGKRKRLNGVHAPSGGATPSLSQLSSSSSSMLNTAPHVLPPPSSLCSHVMKRILLPATDDILEDTEDAVRKGTRGGAEGYQTKEEVHTSFDEEASLQSKKVRSESREEQAPSLVRTLDHSPTYPWLVSYFTSSS